MDRKVINGIRNLSLDMINEAKSGHPGICLSMAPTIYTLFSKHLKFNPNDPEWMNRDRFVMSCGHGSALLYSTLFFAGYKINLDELRKFRQLGSRIQGHPEYNLEIGVETTTGPLGEGIATAVGMAIAEEYYRNNIGSNIFNYNTYCLVSDGDLMEGISYEAISLAGSLKLGKLIVLYDSNNISLDGTTKGIFDESILKRFEASNWHIETVNNGEDFESISKAIEKAKSVTDKPSLIEIKTILGIGSILQGTNAVHGKPLTEEDLLSVKEKMGVNNVPFYVSKDAVEHFREEIQKRNDSLYNEWITKYNEFMSNDTIYKKTVSNIESKSLSIDFNNINIEKNDYEELRVTNSKVMNFINGVSPLFVGGSADLASSTKTYLSEGKDFKIGGVFGKNIHYGVRENAMAAISNGLALSGLRPFCSTFLTFSDYLRPGMRLTALMNLPVTYVFTHDSIGVGEDGPTHQPIEQLGNLRSVPNMTVFRPADLNEVIGSWDYIINEKVPASLVINKSSVSTLTSSIEGTKRGAYIIKPESSRLSGVIIATGSEVHTALNISESLAKKGISLRVISMPSVELFNKQSKEYKEQLLPIGSKIFVLEASNDPIWNQFVYNSKYLLTLNNYGASGKSIDVLKHFGFDEESLENRILELLK